MQKFLKDVRASGFVPRGIIDVGANQGGWTKDALSVFPEAHIIMVEPQAEMMFPLEALCRQNPAVRSFWPTRPRILQQRSHV
jgi:FkbM family methyltransferase